MSRIDFEFFFEQLWFILRIFSGVVLCGLGGAAFCYLIGATGTVQQIIWFFIGVFISNFILGWIHWFPGD